MNSSRKKHASRNKKPRLPSWLILLGIMLAGVAALFAWSAIYDNSSTQSAGGVTIETQGRPKLVVSPEQIDMGDVKLGQTVNAQFKLGNAGDQPLRFTQVPIIQVVEGC
jgi:hypothetical protein